MFKFIMLSLFCGIVAGQMTQAMRDRILKDHNDKRRTATNAANMIELRYDMALEQVAQAYLNRGCSGGFRHNSNRGCDYTARGGRNGGSGSCASVGENWYSGYPDNSQGVDVVIGGAVSQWTDGTCSSWASPPLRCASNWCSEKQNFYQTGSDSYGRCTQNSGQTLHYTQAMWATTTHVGCYYTAACGTLCNYAPAGNMNLPAMGSMREANVWKIGTQCSACPSGYGRCNNGLCSASTAAASSCPADSTNKPTNGNVGTCGSTTAVGSSCTQVCNSGYKLTSGSFSRTCSSSGTLSGVTAVCSQITCPADTSKPVNGNAGTCSSASRSYGQTCSQACNAGFYLSSGSLIRTCGGTGSYGASTAVCTANTPAPTTPAPATTRPPATTPGNSADGYCTSGPTSNVDSEFGPVSLDGYQSTIDDTNGCPGITGVTDLTTQVVILVIGQTYKLNYLRSTCGDYYTALHGAWIDWNQNKAWESSETLFAFSTQNGANNRSFTVPSTALPGQTRMRLQLQETEASTLNPCAMFEWGDTKDYTIFVIAGISCSGNANIKPVNGNAGTCLSTYYVGQTCTQRCNAGYQLTYGSLTSQCGANGQYSAPTGVCTAIPVAPATGAVTATEATPETVSQTTSQIDFVTSAEAAPQFAVCSPDSSTPVNGGAGTCNQPVPIGLNCTQTCNTGFRLRSGTSLVRECNAAGLSASTAVCE